MTQLLDASWPQARVGEALVSGEMAPFIRCWGGADAPTGARYQMAYSRCFGEDRIYMNADFRTGMVNYEFYWFESEDLNPWQFYNRYQQSFSGAAPANTAGEKHVESFSCYNDFVSIQSASAIAAEQETKSSGFSGSEWKMIVCARPYKQFTGLFDVMLMAATIDRDQRGLISHFSLAGVSQDLAAQFIRKFMEHVSWR
jgi:hypothetical protein